MQLLVATHVMAPIAIGSYSPAFAFWFICLTLITAMAFLGALRQNLIVALTLAFLAAGSALTACGFYAASSTVVNAGGWLFVCAAATAWVAASAMMLEHAWGRTIIPLAKWSKGANIPGAQATDPIAYPAGMPGVRVGQ